MRRVCLLIAFTAAVAAVVFGELGDILAPSPDHPAIGYFNYLTHPARDRVAELNHNDGRHLRLAAGDS